MAARVRYARGATKIPSPAFIINGEKTKMKNTQLTKLVSEMRKLSIEKKVDFWKKIASELEKPRRKMREVNVAKIVKVAKKGETAVVPGKVLGSGRADVEIAAFMASASAKKDNKIITLNELMKKNPAGKACRVVC